MRNTSLVLMPFLCSRYMDHMTYLLSPVNSPHDCPFAADPFTACARVLSKLADLSKDSTIDSKATVNELWELRLAHPEVDSMAESGIGESPDMISASPFTLRRQCFALQRKSLTSL